METKKQQYLKKKETCSWLTYFFSIRQIFDSWTGREERATGCPALRCHNSARVYDALPSSSLTDFPMALLLTLRSSFTRRGAPQAFYMAQQSGFLLLVQTICLAHICVNFVCQICRKNRQQRVSVSHKRRGRERSTVGKALDTSALMAASYC